MSLYTGPPILQALVKQKEITLHTDIDGIPYSFFLKFSPVPLLQAKSGPSAYLRVDYNETRNDYVHFYGKFENGVPFKLIITRNKDNHAMAVGCFYLYESHRCTFDIPLTEALF